MEHKILPNWLYEAIKYLCAIGLPAISVAILSLGKIFGWEWANDCSQVLVVVQTLLGSLFCISAATYVKEDE